MKNKIEFKTQKDIWTYLVNGGKIINKDSKGIFYFENGSLKKFNSCEQFSLLNFRYPEDWESIVFQLSETFECNWTKFNGGVVPTGKDVLEKLEKFAGKRTKITVTEC